MRGVITARLGLLAVSHFTIDAYSSFFAPLLPLLVAKLDLSLTMVGTLVAFSSLSTSFAQPLFGLLSDRLSRPWFVAFGPLAAALFMSAVGMASSYWGLVALLMLGGLGVAAFHPEAAALAAAVSPRRGMAMALFVTGGTLGFAIGPLLAVGVVSVFGLERSWVAALPGLVVAALMLIWFMRVHPRHRPKATRPKLAALRPVLRPLTLLYFAVVSRSAVSYGFMTFLPLHLTSKGYSVTQSGVIVSLYLGAGALGGLLGGWLADRWGGRRVVVSSFIGGLPLYYAFLFLPDPLSLACLVLGSFVLQTSLPVNVVMGQELSPQHSSTIASLLMGAAWGLGALIVSPVGALADAFGLRQALFSLALILTGGLACAIALPEVRRPAGPAEIAQPAGGAAGK